MCPPNVFHLINGLDAGTQQLLINVVKRKSFGVGASPRTASGNRTVYITSAMVDGLVKRIGFYPKSGQPRFRLTRCGRRVAKFLVARDEQADPTLLDADYNSGTCPLDEDTEEFDITQMGYHDYEHWDEKRYRNPTRRRNTINYGPLRRFNPTKQQKLRKWEKIKLKTAPRIRAWVEQRVEDQQPVTYRLVSRLIGDYADRYKVPSAWAWEHMQECGVRNILLRGPMYPDQHPPRGSWLRPTADWMWSRRDLRQP